MNIHQLPVEILQKIFKYLPSYESVSLVDKRFYNVVCALRDSKVYLRLDASLFNKRRNHLLPSIHKTTRRINNLCLDFTSPIEPVVYESIIEIITNFSSTTQYLALYGNLKMSEFLQILKLVPNAVHLVFKNVQTLRVEDQSSQKKRRIIPNSEDLDLHRLETLEFQDCNDEFVIEFNRLPAGVLKKLSLKHRNLNELAVLFKRQTSIKKLEITWYAHGFPIPQAAADIFNNQELECLEWHYNTFNCSNIGTILSQQTTLKSLKLIDGVVGEAIMNVVANRLTELETFSMYLPETPIAAFKNIKRLRNLKDVSLQGDEDQNVIPHLKAFARLDNSRVTTLDIRNMYGLTDSLITELALSVPNLKVLRYNCDYKFKMVNAIMRNFNFVEMLELDPTDQRYCCDDDDDASLIEGDCNNPNLIELSITYLLPYNTGFLEKLIGDYPNLKKFAIQSITPLTTAQFKLILNGLRKLESLSLFGGASELNVNDLNYLTDHQSHLKFVSLMDMGRIKFKPRMEKRLRKMFDVIQYTHSDGLKMAIGGKTVKAEAIC